MIIFQFHYFIKPESIETYKEAILEDARESVKEEGIIRFEVFQDKEDPAHFRLVEMYTDIAAREYHLQKPYFLKFKDKVVGQEMFARKDDGNQFDRLFPEE